MAAVEEIPAWQMPPLRASAEEKEEHARRRKEIEDRLIPEIKRLIEERGISVNNVVREEAIDILLGRFLRARRYQVIRCFSSIFSSFLLLACRLLSRLKML
jgi:hypothetical protein